MEPTKLGELLRGVGVTKQPDLVIDRVETDSRKAGPGSLFVAVVGERLDGNDYVEQAFENGAAAAVVSRDDLGLGGEMVVVSDTKDALIEMGGNYRAKFDPKVAGITGSVGKTTTKEMTAAIFERFGPTLKNTGNMNNEIGLPSTLFNMDSKTELAVLEMGMNRLGDISKLTRAARPKVAAITAIGVSHLEHLGSRENILKAKLEIIEGMPKDGVLVLNGEDDYLMGARGDLDIETATFAIDNSDADVSARDVMARDRETEFTIFDRLSGSFSAMIPAVGSHNIMDALAAYTVATRLGLDPAGAADALQHYESTGMRQHIVDHNGITVIEDCYNASPDSMSAALQLLTSLPVDGIRVAVLGDMLELGDITREAHMALGIEAARAGIDVLLCYGDAMRYCAEAGAAAGIPNVEHFTNKPELARYLAKTVRSGDAVVFKGSRGMQLEDVIEMFYKL